MESKQAINYMYVLIFIFIHVAHVIKKLELSLLLIYVRKIKFEYTQIGVIEILMLRAACINPWFVNVYQTTYGYM